MVGSLARRMSSIVEKYEQILAADPRSRIFVELAKALVDRGDHARAAEVCRRGLEHHPSSVLGRVTWGRALLEGGDTDAAKAQFELALALDPKSPYAYNLVGEALVHEELWALALPVVTRAAELQPGDARVKGWLDELHRHLPDAAAHAPEAPSTAPVAEDAPDEPLGPPAGDADATADGDANADGGATRREIPVLARVQPPGGDGAPAADEPLAPVRATPPPIPAGATPPPRPPPVPRAAPAEREVTDARFALSLLPGTARDELPPAATGARPRSGAVAPAPDAAEAARIAAQYEHDLRAKLMSAPEPPPHPLRRHRRAVAAGAVLVALGGAAAVYLVLRSRARAEEVAHAAEWGRTALARDTVSALRKAAGVLASAREVQPSDRALASLDAQVLAVLASDHSDEKARVAAKALADPAVAGDGALVVHLLLADGAAERKAAEEAVLAAPPSSAPLVETLAGELLLRRGEADAGRRRLELAARAHPPLLRALADLGDAALAAGDPAGALAYYQAALGAEPRHARSAIGAAEARLALGRDLATSRRELEAIDADPGSAPPAAARVRFEIAYARVLAALGDPAAATARLAKAQEKLGRQAALAGAAAEIHLAARAYDRAEPEAARAVALAPRDPAWHVLLARARIGRGQYAEALAATAGFDDRAVRVQRAIARYDLGQYREAKAELERTARDGKMPAEAAVWYALCDVALGRADRAEPLLAKLAAAKPAPPLALVALGRAEEARGGIEDAEKSYRAAVEQDPTAPEANAALGRVLLSRGLAKEAVPYLERAAKADPFAVDARLALGEARLAAGDPGAARAELDAVLLQRPRDARALRDLSAARLAEGDAGAARRAAERAAEADPKNPASWIALARAELDGGDAAGAKRAAARAVKLAGKGPQAAVARRALADASARR